MTNEITRKWSIEEFYGLIRHHLTDDKGTVELPTVELPIELIEGRIVPSPVSEQLDRQVERLKQQIQQVLEQTDFKGFEKEFEVRSHYPIQIDPYSELRPTLTVVSTQQSQETIHWVIDINKTAIHPTEAATGQDIRSHLYAHYGITEYWALSTEQVELRTHHTPEAINQENNELVTQYRHHQLQHVGEQMHPTAFPQLTMQIQEPLPLYFLTRTATGHRTYTETMLPLQVQR